MERYIFVFASLTTANRVKFHLKNKYGMSYDIEKVSKSTLTPGCSYGLTVPEGRVGEVKEIIKNLDVNLIGVFGEAELKGGEKNGLS